MRERYPAHYRAKFEYQTVLEWEWDRYSCVYDFGGRGYLRKR